MANKKYDIHRIDFVFVLQISSMSAVLFELKPTLRGRFHQIAFYIYAICSLYLIFSTRTGIVRIAFALYLATVNNMLYISSILHTIDWMRPELEERVQKVDHASIFLLIAGSYTPTCLSCLPQGHPASLYILISTWIIALAGIVKCILYTNVSRALNVGFYFLCGLTVVPYLPLITEHLSLWMMAAFASGGAMYLAGGMIYGLKKPDPIPEHFGYHEIFHILTILANLCFIVPILSCSM